MLLSGTSHAMTTSLPAPISILKASSTPLLDHTRLKACTGKLSYPLLALRREAEGETTLFLEVNGQGRISDVDVIQSSGHVDLDQASINFLETCTVDRPAGLEAGEMFYTKIQFVWKLDPADPVEAPKVAPSKK